MAEHFELLDLYKAIAAIIAGLILGFEREIKDKSAGLKTITVICLGSALFSILSYKVAGHGDPSRIASLIVTGVGFLGAGVIYKEGFNIFGLTTAGIIWVSAAIGMSIGFGHFYTALIFLLSALFIVFCTELLEKHFIPQYHNRLLKIKILTIDFSKKNEIISDIKKISKEAEEIGVEKNDHDLLITVDLHASSKELQNLENYLINNRDLIFFSY